MFSASKLKQLYIDFFVSKNHKEIPSSPVIPENDPTTLFNSAGMQPLVPFLLGAPYPLGKRLVDVQKCVRTGDIDEVGDTFHHTFFEMLGNWSLGDYFKKESIEYSFEFLTKHLNIDVNKLHVTCFVGDNDAPKDSESADIWESMGISKDRIHFLPKEDNWWGPAGATGPCGPDTEIFMEVIEGCKIFDNMTPDESFVLNCKLGTIVEIWNNVFMQYSKDESGKFTEMSQKNVDTGMGVERTIAVLSGQSDNYMTDIWQPIIKKIEEISGKKYNGDDVRYFRIISDHIRASVFIIADGIEPSNKGAGYVLRRLIRRSIRQGKLLGIDNPFITQVAQAVLDNQSNYAGIYAELDKKRNKIIEVLEIEEQKFQKTVTKGINEIMKLSVYSGKKAFEIYQSFGFPPEMYLEEVEKIKYNNTPGKSSEMIGALIDLQDKDKFWSEFNLEKQKHTKLSQTLSSGMFKSGLADHSIQKTKFHTATHLLHTALRQVLGDHVQQSGSNITEDRLRFDFSHPQKISPDQIEKIENLVNQTIKKNLEITKLEISFEQAKKSGALAFFANKYPEIVNVYQIGDFSREVCTGPHVTNTKELGIFKITKEESAGSGKRRIYAVLN